MKQDDSNQPIEQSGTGDARPMISPRRTSPRRGVGKSIIGALVILAFDVGLAGTCMFALLVCPIWFLVSVIKNSIQMPGWRIAAIRIAIPLLTLWLSWINGNFQYNIAEEHASIIIPACEKYHVEKNEYPKTLDDLVPDYLPSVPRAKYCLYGHFSYWNLEEHPILVWYYLPPYGRKIYNFDRREWHYLD